MIAPQTDEYLAFVTLRKCGDDDSVVRRYYASLREVKDIGENKSITWLFGRYKPLPLMEAQRITERSHSSNDSDLIWRI